MEDEGENKGKKPGYITPATGAIIALNILVFGAMVIFAGTAAITGPNQQTLLTFGANYGVRTMYGEYWRNLTCIFVHIGLLHCFMNMWIFAVMGPNLERIFGSAKFVIVYVFAGLIASLTSVFVHPNNISAGASGAVFGIFGLWFGFLLANRGILKEDFVKNNSKSAVVFLIMVLAQGFMRSGTDNGAHIGGVLAGFVSGFLICPNIPDQPRWRAKDFAGIFVMLLMIGGAFYASYERTNQAIAQQTADLAPGDVKEAVSLLKNNKPQEAMQILNELLQKDPRNSKAHYLRAHAYLLLREPVKALEDMNTVLERHPEHLAALEFKTQRLIELMRYPAAINTVNKIIELKPQDASGYLLRSSIYDRMNDKHNSLEDSNQAVSLDPDNANAFSSRGYSYINLGLGEDAINDFTKAIKLDPGLIGAMNGRMFAYFMQADYIACDKQCVDILAKVGMHDRCAPYAVIMSAICKRQLKQEPHRIAMITQALQTLDSNSWPYPIVLYLSGQITADQVFRQATDNDKMTEAKTYVAFDLLAGDKGTEASPMIVWVKEHGNKTFNEYDLVCALLAKVQK